MSHQGVALFGREGHLRWKVTGHISPPGLSHRTKGVGLCAWLLQQPMGDVAKPCAAHHPLDRQAVDSQVLFEPAGQLPFLIAARCEFAMSTLAGESHQPVAGANASSHAEAGPSSKDGQGPVVLTPLLQHHLLIRAEVRQAVDQYTEIVHQLQLLHPCGGSQILFLELPGEVGDPGLPIANRACHGDAAMGWRLDVLGPFLNKRLKHRLQR